MIKNISFFILVLFFSTAHSMKLVPGDILMEFIQIKPVNNVQATMELGRDISMDANRNLYGLIDEGISQTNLATGEQRTIFPNGVPRKFRGMIVDRNGQLIVFEGNSISQIDPVTGQQTVLTSGGLIGTIYLITLDINDDILVVGKDSSHVDTLFRFNPISGDTSIITAELNTRPLFLDIRQILFDKNGNYVVHSERTFYTIDRDTGNITEKFPGHQFIAQDGSVMFRSRIDGFIDENNNIIAIYNHQLIKIDTASNEVTPLYSETSLLSIISVYEDSIYVQTKDADRIIILDRSTFTPEIEIERYTGRVNTIDIRAVNVSLKNEIFFTTRTEIFKINPITGKISAIASDGLLTLIRAIEVEKNGDLLVSSRNGSAIGGAIIRINPDTGAQTLVTRGNMITPIGDIALGKNGIIYFLTSRSSTRSCIIAVDPSTGEQTEVYIEKLQLPLFCRGSSLTIDKADNIIVGQAGRVVRLDRENGTVTTIVERGDNSPDSDLFYSADDVAIAPDGSILILDIRSNTKNSLFRINPNTGDQEQISSGGFLAKNDLGDCSCLSIVPGDGSSSAVPIPSIKANGGTSNIALQQRQNLTVTISLEPGIDSEQGRDWWVAAASPFGLFWLDSQLQWIQSADPVRAYVGPLFKLSDFSILNPTALPTGNYTFYFAVDNDADNVLDAHNLGSVEVSIQRGP